MSRLTSRPDSGIALALAAVIVILIAGLGTALATFSLSHNRKGEMSNEAMIAQYAADAALEEVSARIRLSFTDPSGNLFLNTKAVPGDRNILEPRTGDAPALPTLVLKPDVKVDVFIYSIDTLSRAFRVLARATAHGRTVVVAQDYWAWDTFARYAMFSDTERLVFGRTKVDGHVHSNQSINFRTGGGEFTQQTSAVSGFSFTNGATIANTAIPFPNIQAPRVEMPSMG